MHPDETTLLSITHKLRLYASAVVSQQTQDEQKKEEKQNELEHEIVH